MDLLQLIVNDVMHLFIGLYGAGVLYLIGSTINDVVEGLVNLIGIQKDKYRLFETR